MCDKLFLNKKILVVTSDFVYPPNHGARVDFWNRIKIFYKMGFNIDLIYTTKEKPSLKYENIVKKYVKNLMMIKRKNKIIDIFSYKPMEMTSRSGLKNIKLKSIYDYVFIEGGSSAIILDNKTLKYKKAILRSHNNDIAYSKQLMKSEKILWRKLYYFINSFKYKYIDSKIVEKVSNIMFISYDEMQQYKNKYNNINAYFLPSAVDFNLKKQILDNKNVLIICSLFMVNNKEAIQFYIEKIHPLLNDIEGYTFTIAGNSKGEGIKWIKDLSSKYNNIKIIDSPENLDDIYANASVFVNPMLHGAGVKLKTVNAIVNGLPVVSTTIGNQGTGLEPGKHIYVADEPEKFASYIRMLLNSKEKRQKLVEESQKYISLYYNQEKILSKYLDEIGRS